MLTRLALHYCTCTLPPEHPSLSGTWESRDRLIQSGCPLPPDLWQSWYPNAWKEWKLAGNSFICPHYMIGAILQGGTKEKGCTGCFQTTYKAATMQSGMWEPSTSTIRQASARTEAGPSSSHSFCKELRRFLFPPSLIAAAAPFEHISSVFIAVKPFFSEICV